jgi:hypothetical protein
VRVSARVLNQHATVLAASVEDVARLIDGLAGPEDRLWPRQVWPAMRLDRGLAPGSAGGHGPIRYHVESYQAGKRIDFRFDGPRGFEGTHSLFIEPLGPGETRLRHVIDMRIQGPALLTWPLIFRPLHDALIEDALSLAEIRTGMPPRVRPWSGYVRALRRLTGGGRARPQPSLQGLFETRPDA